MRMPRQHEGRAFSAHAEKLFECLWGCDRCLAGKAAAHVGCGLPLHQSSILQERDSKGLRARFSQGDDLEGPVATANHIQQSLGVSGVGITDDGDLSRL